MPIVLNKLHLSKLSNSADQHEAIDLLESYAHYQLKAPAIIKSYHDMLLFYAAFPNNKKIADLASAGLNRIAETTGIIYRSGNAKLKDSLLASGIAQTALLCGYSCSIADWLVNRFPDCVELGMSDASKDTVTNIIQALSPDIEYEKSSQGEFNLSTRIKHISGLNNPGDQLKWLLQLFHDSGLPERIKEMLYQQLKVYIRWNLSDALFNRSFLRLPVDPVFYHKSFLRKVNSTSIIRKKTGEPIALSSSEKNFLLDTMKASLAFQYRETDPVTYADKSELDLFDMGRGLQIAIVGMTKDKRLAMESYVGYMAFKNGIPVSYGGGWMWGQRCKIGVNIYPPFRRGESAWLFCQILRLYYQYFGVRHFIVKPYQFGKGNPEGLISGAFWFYYKLGFRPVNEKIKQDAAIEWEKIKTVKNYRTTLKVLQHFTSCPIEWKLNKDSCPYFDAGKISIAVSNMINRNYSGNRKLAITSCLSKMKKIFPASSIKRDTGCQEKIAANWGLLTALIGDLPHWSIREKKAIADLIKLKQTGKERDYMIRLQKQEKLWNALQQVIAKQ